MTDHCDRRQMLWLGAGALVALGSLARCSKRQADPDSIRCTAQELSADDQRTRTALGYVERSPQANKSCSQCQQYVPAPSEDACGSCKILKGPMHPAGYCNAYSPRS